MGEIPNPVVDPKASKDRPRGTRPVIEPLRGVPQAGLASGAAEAPAEWVESLAREGYDPWVDHSGHCWIRRYHWCRVRFPDNDPAPLHPDERRDLFQRLRAWVISHHHVPSPGEDANAFLYLCRHRGYDIDCLSGNNRSKVRRGLRRHEVREIDEVEVAANGYECYADSRARNDLTPWPRSSFSRWWRSRGSAPCRRIWGAFAQGELVAYLASQVCGRWVEIYASVARTSHLRSFPSHALCFGALRHFLSEVPSIESVSFGLSSLQPESHLQSLHQYKLSLGFEAVPVVRVIEVHPLLRPFVNRPTRRILRMAERIRPTNLVLCKTRALFDYLLDGQLPSLPAAIDTPQHHTEDDIPPDTFDRPE